MQALKKENKRSKKLGFIHIKIIAVNKKLSDWSAYVQVERSHARFINNAFVGKPNQSPQVFTARVDIPRNCEMTFGGAKDSGNENDWGSFIVPVGSKDAAPRCYSTIDHVFNQMLMPVGKHRDTVLYHYVRMFAKLPSQHMWMLACKDVNFPHYMSPVAQKQRFNTKNINDNDEEAKVASMFVKRISGYIAPAVDISIDQVNADPLRHITETGILMKLPKPNVMKYLFNYDVEHHPAAEDRRIKHVVNLAAAMFALDMYNSTSAFSIEGMLSKISRDFGISGRNVLEKVHKYTVNSPQHTDMFTTERILAYERDLAVDLLEFAGVPTRIAVSKKRGYGDDVAAPIKKRKCTKDSVEVKEGASREIDGNQLSAEQLHAINISTDVNIKLNVITGSPGTGKTTTCGHIVQRLLTQYEFIYLCAPTGAAAQRLFISVCDTLPHAVHQNRMQYGTIHLLVYCKNIIPYDGNDTTPMRIAIVADESSMLDYCLTRRLVDFISGDVSLFAKDMAHAPQYGIVKKLILVGDPQQLPSIGHGDVFNDIINSNAFPVARLTRIYRQGVYSSVPHNSLIVYNNTMGNVDEFEQDVNFQVTFAADPKQIVGTVIDVVRHWQREYDVRKKDVLIIAQINKTVTEINTHYQTATRPICLLDNKYCKNYHVDNGEELVVIENVNDVAVRVHQIEATEQYTVGDDGVRLINGERVVFVTSKNVQGASGGSSQYHIFLRLISRQVQIMVMMVSTSARNVLSPIHAMNVYKAQGSEQKYVVVILDGKEQYQKRSALYTAITRGKQSVHVVAADRKTLMTSMTRQVQRYTHLQYFLSSKSQV